MTFIRSIGKECKSKMLHFTEAEAGFVFIAGISFNLFLIGLIAFL